MPVQLEIETGYQLGISRRLTGRFGGLNSGCPLGCACGSISERGHGCLTNELPSFFARHWRRYDAVGEECPWSNRLYRRFHQKQRFAHSSNRRLMKKVRWSIGSPDKQGGASSIASTFSIKSISVKSTMSPSTIFRTVGKREAGADCRGHRGAHQSGRLRPCGLAQSALR